MYLCGIDLGTTGCKSMIFDTEGNILGDHYIEYDLIFTPEGWVEQDAHLWWEHTKSAVKGALAKAGVDGREVRGVSISSQGISFVPVDKDGNTLQNAFSWYDTRSAAEAAEIGEFYGADRLYDVCGRSPSTLMFPEVLWIKRHRPEIYHNTYKFLMGMDFLVYRLCGAAVTDYTMASGTLAYDTVKRAWISEIFDRFGVDVDKFPSIACLGDAVGTVTPSVAAELGLSSKTVVALGGQDQKICAIGAGIAEGVLTDSLGTASAICSIAPKHFADPEKAAACHGFDTGRWMIENCVGTAGSALKWVKNTLFSSLSYRRMDELAAAAKPGSNGVFFFPYLSREDTGRNVGTFTGLGLDITQGDVCRSVLEGIAFCIRDLVDDHRRVSAAAAAATELRCFGGGAQSPVWLQIIADITGLRIVVPRTHEVGCLGAAICGGVGAGVFRDFDDARRIVGSPKAVYEPEPALRSFYEEKLGEYIAARDKALGR